MTSSLASEAVAQVASPGHRLGLCSSQPPPHSRSCWLCPSRGPRLCGLQQPSLSLSPGAIWLLHPGLSTASRAGSLSAGLGAGLCVIGDLKWERGPGP